MLKKLLLLAGLFGTLLASCSQDDSDRLAHEATTPEGPGVEVMLNFGAEQFRDTSLEQGQKTQSGRAFDYVVYDEMNGGTTTTSSHLDLSSVKGDIKATVILRSTDSSQPVTVGEITMERRTSYPDGSAVPADRVYLHTKAGGSPVNAKAGTDFTKGTWSVALVIGGKRSGSTLAFDPNNLESVKYSDDSQSDQGIDRFSAQNKWNLKGITKSTKGDSYTDEEKVTLDVPFFSQWITLADGDSSIRQVATMLSSSVAASPFALRGRFSDLRSRMRTSPTSSWRGSVSSRICLPSVVSMTSPMPTSAHRRISLLLGRVFVPMVRPSSTQQI